MSSSTPPPNNPVLSAYESFLTQTPLVTRYALSTFTVSFVLSSFLPLQISIANIPYFTIFRLELYRIFLSCFLCTSILNLIFGFISFLDQGKRLEFAMGSTNFATLLLLIGVGVNVIFTFGTLMLYMVTRYEPYIMYQCGGMWILIFGVIAMECSLAEEGSKRRLFVIDVPTLYYPLALLGLFTLFGLDIATVIPNLLSIGIGYAYGFGKLDFLKLSIERRRRIEAGLLRSFTGRTGWVVGPAGYDWVMMSPSQIRGNNHSGNAADEEQGWTPNIIRRRESTSTTTSSSQIPKGASGGHILGRGGSDSGGITSRRTNLSPSPDRQSERERRLAAAERRVHSISNEAKGEE